MALGQIFKEAEGKVTVAVGVHAGDQISAGCQWSLFNPETIWFRLNISLNFSAF